MVDYGCEIFGFSLPSSTSTYVFLFLPCFFSFFCTLLCRLENFEEGQREPCSRFSFLSLSLVLGTVMCTRASNERLLYQVISTRKFCHLL